MGPQQSLPAVVAEALDRVHARITSFQVDTENRLSTLETLMRERTDDRSNRWSAVGVVVAIVMSLASIAVVLVTGGH